jgi:hypothetical protein
MRPAEGLWTRTDLIQPATANPKSGAGASNATPACCSKRSGAGPRRAKLAAHEEPNALEATWTTHQTARDRLLPKIVMVMTSGTVRGASPAHRRACVRWPKTGLCKAVCQFREYGSGTLLKAELPWKSVCQIPGIRPGNRPQSSRGVESREFDPSFPDKMGPGTRAWELWVPFDFSFWKERVDD